MNKKFLKSFLIGAVLFSLVLPVQNIKAQEYVEILNVDASLMANGAIKIEWLTNTETQAKVIYGEASDNLNGYINIKATPSRYNSVEISGLKSKTTYYYQIIVYRNSVESARSFINKIKTEEAGNSFAPTIEDLQVPFIGGSVAIVSWRTDEDSTSVVEYSKDQSYGSKASAKGKTKEHVVVLKKLAPDEKYYMRAYSENANGGKSDYVYRILYTLEKNTHDYDDMKISYLRPSGPDDIYITENSITVIFKTNRYSTGEVSLKKAKSKAQVIDLEYGTEHRAVFYDLDPETVYTLAVKMNDPLGKKASEELTVKTKEQKIVPASSEDEEVVVSGIEHSYYTLSQGLYKAEGGSRIYSVLAGKKHYITSPASFNEYGYEWSKVKTISQKNLDNMPRVKLVKSPDKSTVYYLYERSGGKLLKLNIPSPAVFESYPANKWGDIVKISQIDIASYPDVKLIKAEGSSKIYYIENNIKRLVSGEVFKAKKFNPEDVATVNQKHLDSYREGSPLK